MSENQPLTEGKPRPRISDETLESIHLRAAAKPPYSTITVGAGNAHAITEELATLRTENTQLLARLAECEARESAARIERGKARDALKIIFDATDPYADGVIDASAHDKLANEIACIARPWKDTE